MELQAKTNPANKLNATLSTRFRLGRPREKMKPPSNLAKKNTSKQQKSWYWPNIWPTNQVTLGITAQSSHRVHIDEKVYDLDVGSGPPNGAAAIKGSFVQRLKPYVIWVQTGEIQVSFYL